MIIFALVFLTLVVAPLGVVGGQAIANAKRLVDVSSARYFNQSIAKDTPFVLDWRIAGRMALFLFVHPVLGAYVFYHRSIKRDLHKGREVLADIASGFLHGMEMSGEITSEAGSRINEAMRRWVVNYGPK